VVVGVIDTGYRPHKDLVGNILPGYDMISDTGVSQDGDGRDSDASDPGDWAPAGVCYSSHPGSNSSWHGTHVAGTIAAVTNNGIGVTGVAYKAKVVPIRVLGRCGGYTSDIADAIIWGAGGSVSGVPDNENPAKVLNLSLGGSGRCGYTQQNAIDTARTLGATVVVAAGNSNTNASNTTPANCSGVVTVAAVDRSGGKAWYSNYGSVVDVASPGGDTRVTANGILSTLNSGSTSPGSDSYAFYQGTSMATPHVAGAAALLYSVDPSITPNEVEATLKNTSRSFPRSCSQCGSGIVDAGAAVPTVSQPVSLIAPNGSEILGYGDAYTIQWDPGVAAGSTVKIEFRAGSSSWRAITYSTANDGAYSWTPSSSVYCSYESRIRITASGGSSDTSATNFSVDCHPEMGLSAPQVRGLILRQNGGASPRCGDFNTAWCKLTSPGASGNGPFKFIWDDGSVSCSWFPGYHVYNGPGDYHVRVQVTNTCGWTAERSTFSFIP
jgi:subtilisin family serine protease